MTRVADRLAKAEEEATAEVEEVVAGAALPLQRSLPGKRPVQSSMQG